jgi:hypothetical protein
MNWNTICHIIGIILPLNKNTLATFTKYRTSVMLTLEIWWAFQQYQFYNFWNCFGPPIKWITELFIFKTEFIWRKDLAAFVHEISRGLRAKSTRSSPSSVPPTGAMALPVAPRLNRFLPRESEPRMDKRTPRPHSSLSSLSLELSLSRPLSPKERPWRKP